MALAQPTDGARYHRLGRTDRAAWWRTLCGIGALLGFGLVFMGIAAALTWGVWEPDLQGPPEPSTGAQLWELGAELLSLAMIIPAAYLAALLVERRPPGLLSSVAGRIRWGWLGICLAICTGVYVVYGAIGFAIDVPRRMDVGLVAGVFALSLVLVPFQAAAEEYLFRGYLAQAFGTWIRSPWPTAIGLSILFGFAHGTIGDQGIWLFVDRAAFGFVAAWLAWRTGGLEAGIALHTIGNVLAMSATAAYGDLADYLATAEEAEGTVGEVLLDIAIFTGTALLMAWAAKRRRLAVTWRGPTWLTRPEDPRLTGLPPGPSVPAASSAPSRAIPAPSRA